MSEPKRDDLLRLVQHLENIIRTQYENDNICLQKEKINDLIDNKYVILYANFNDCTSVEKAVFALWALQNPDKVKYDIVQAIKPSENDLAIFFYTNFAGGFYYDPTNTTELCYEEFGEIYCKFEYTTCNK